MSRQASLDFYFKCKSSPTPVKSNSKTMKRRSLSLIKTPLPQKATKINSIQSVKTEEETVNLCSDDESASLHEMNPNINLSQNTVKSEASDSSDATIIYNLTPQTPHKSPQALSNYLNSPTSKEKFYSPTKKRNVFKKTSIKRKLVLDYNTNISKPHCNPVEDEEFSKACEGLDDKSIFLLTIINNCLKDDNLKVLLDNSSVELLRHCLHLIKPGISLVCRMYWRKHAWYTREKLMSIKDETKIDNNIHFQNVLDCLVEKKLVVSSIEAGTNVMTFDDLTNILTLDKIKQICKDLKIKIQSKQDGVEALRRFSRKSSISNYFTGRNSNNSNRIMDMLRINVGPCYKLSELACTCLHKLYLLMYLGMNYEAIREKKLELMLINDKIKRETYPVDKGMAVDNASVVFGNRDEFEKYFHAHTIYEEYFIVSDTQEKCVIVKKVYRLYKEIDSEDMTRYKAMNPWLRRYTPAYVYVKILESGIQELKKLKHCELALDILTSLINQSAFRQHKKADWYAEKALVLHKLLAQHDEAAKVLIEGLTSNLSDEAKDAMRPRAYKLAAQRNITLSADLLLTLTECSGECILENSFHADHFQKQHMELDQRRGKKKFEIHTDEGKKFVDVENYCVIHYTTRGVYTHGEHWEGRIATTIYFLLFWDIIYTKPRGAVGIFLSHYQMFPLDMYTESFYVNRKTLIDDRLETIENMDKTNLIEMLQQKWEERPEYEISGINRSIGWENVRMVASCLGCKPTAALCRRLATHYGYAHSGFPDLTLWNIHTGKIKFVEVKSDTDKPSTKQLQWMRYLRDNGIDTGFCYVGVSTTRCRARAVESTPKRVVKTPAAKAVKRTTAKARTARAAETPTIQVKSVSDINRAAETIS